MNKEQAASLWAQVQENQRKLRSCKGHKFGDVLGSTTIPTNPSFECKMCGGYMKAHDIYIYALGYKAGGGNPDNVARFVEGESLNDIN